MASMHKLVGEIIRAGARLAANRNNLLLTLRVTGAGMRLLKAVRMTPFPLSITTLARMMCVSRQAVRDTARELEAEGLITLETNPWNSRAFLVSLTDEGRSRLEQLMRLERRWAAGLARGLSEPLRAQTAWVLRTLRERCSHLPISMQGDPRTAAKRSPLASGQYRRQPSDEYR
jgi:DNA-binding MarR family transcriptional regulator